MEYPKKREIPEFFNRLAPEVKAALAPLASKAQRRYRRVRRESEGNPSALARVVSEHAEEVFMTRVVPLLKAQSSEDDDPAFRRAIARDGGEAETAFYYAFKLVQDAEHGEESLAWYRETESRLRQLVREAEDQQADLDVVLDGWQKFFSESGVSLPPMDAAAGAPPVGEAAQPARKAPADFFGAYHAKNPTMTYDNIGGRIGISRDGLFKIKGERAWVRDYAYEAAAKLLGCRPEDLYPRNLPKVPRRPRTRAK